jgi:hypothetical protein
MYGLIYVINAIRSEIVHKRFVKVGPREPLENHFKITVHLDRQALAMHNEEVVVVSKEYYAITHYSLHMQKYISSIALNRSISRCT